MAVELRRPGLARSTQDVDVVLRPGLVDDPGDSEELREVLLDALGDDVDGDRFVYRVGRSVRLRDDAYGRPAWRFRVDATLAGRSFAGLRLDVVARPEEVGGVEERALPDVLSFAGVPIRSFQVADLRQQYAEKLHALTRTYASGVSSRVKDLLDLVLLIEDGVVPDGALVAREQRVCTVRGTHDVPAQLTPPPDSWERPFTRLAAEVGLDITSAAQAHDMVAGHWSRAQSLPVEEG